jgi:hypothetical protein
MQTSFILFAFLSMAFQAPTVLADRGVVFLFNNLTGPVAGLSCTASDNLILNPIFNISNYVVKRRQLRSSNRSVEMNDMTQDIDQNDRVLLEPSASSCASQCKAQAMPCRSLTGCQTSRRELQASDTLMYATCSDQVAEMHKRLDTVVATS